MPGNYSGYDLSSAGFLIRVNLAALLSMKVKIFDHKSAADPYRSKWHQKKQMT